MERFILPVLSCQFFYLKLWEKKFLEAFHEEATLRSCLNNYALYFLSDRI